MKNILNTIGKLIVAGIFDSYKVRQFGMNNRFYLCADVKLKTGEVVVINNRGGIGGLASHMNLRLPEELKQKIENIIKAG